MRSSGRLLRVLIGMVSAALLLSLVAVPVHTHVGGGFRPDCPACQKERTTGVSSAAVDVVVLAPAVVDVDDVVLLVPGADLPLPTLNQAPPRSPPLSPLV